MPDPSEPPNKSKRGVNGGEVVLGDGHKVQLADFPERLAARFLDPVVVILFALCTYVIGGVAWFMPSFGAGADLTRVAILRTNLVVSFVALSVVVLYEMAAIGLSGQTWGKRRRRVRVVACRDGATPPSARALVRALVPAVAGVSGCVGAALADSWPPALGGLVMWLVVYVSAMWGRDGRGWHDLAAGTVVIVDPRTRSSQARMTCAGPGPGPATGEATAHRGRRCDLCA